MPDEPQFQITTIQGLRMSFKWNEQSYIHSESDPNKIAFNDVYQSKGEEIELDRM